LFGSVDNSSETNIINKYNKSTSKTYESVQLNRCYTEYELDKLKLIRDGIIVIYIMMSK